MSKVVAALIIYRNSFLLLKRARSPFEGAWEFPNAKARRGETARDVIKNHLKTTLGIDILPLYILDGFNTAYPQHDLALLRCSIMSHPAAVSTDTSYSDHSWTYILNTTTLALASIHDDIAIYLLNDNFVITRKSKGPGFVSIDKSKQQLIAGSGGKKAHALGRAHKWTKDEARRAGAIGGHGPRTTKRSGVK